MGKNNNFWHQIQNGLSGFRKREKSNLLLVLMVVIGIFFMYYGAKPGQQSVPDKIIEEKDLVPIPGGQESYKEQLEKELTALLKQIHGVGKVAVYISLEGGPEYEFSKDMEKTEKATTEDDGEGGTRIITENAERWQTVIIRTDGNSEKPLITQEKEPAIRGVIVVAEGARNPEVQERIAQALQSGLGLSAHRIRVLPMK